MIYAKNIAISNWKELQRDLIDFKYSQGNDALWWSYTEQEVKENLPILYKTLCDMGLHLRQLIFFDNAPNDLLVDDPNNERCLFIHTDSEDKEDSLGTPQPDEIEFSTDFNPEFAINIPLENCENSLTLWYELLDKEQAGVHYPKYDCGGHDPKNCKEVYRFELTQPAVLRINAPHAVHNPHTELRTVATMRFYTDLSYLL